MDTAKVIAHITSLAQAGFWGAVKVKFEAGRAVHIIQEESFVPAALSEEPSSLDVFRS
jgi:hypothetical protein